jgi:glycosyltransferase involved in cell wall biosynthesis
VQVAVDGRVVTDHFPGIGRYVYRLVEALAVAAPDDRFAVLHTPGQVDRRFDLTRLAEAANVHLVPVAAPVFGAAAQWRIPRAIVGAGATAFHATYWVTALRPGVPTVLSIYDLIGLSLAGAVPGPRRLALGLAVRLAARGAREVVTLSEWSKADLVRALGLEPARVTVTHLAPDPHFRPADPAAVRSLRARLGLPERYVLYVGINKPHKNLATLVEAWGRTAPRLADAAAELVLAGPLDPRYPEASHALAHLPSGARGRVLGPVTDADLPALYTGAAAFAFPSRYEGFGLPPLEAMACGAPVVAARATSLPEVLGEAALFVAPDDPAAWAEALLRVLTAPDLAADLGARGQAHARQFTWRATAERTLTVYRRIARG